MKILCTGDLHLGAGSEYGREPGDRLQDQADVWARIIELAYDRHVDLILFAGDAFEGPIPTSEHYEAFQAPLRAHAGGIPVLAISGNGRHDSAMRSTNALQIFDGLVTVSARPDVYRIAGAVVATLPWVSPARLIARYGRDVNRDEVNAEVAQLLLDIARRGKEDCETIAPEEPHILLGHWSVTGSALPNGLPVADLREPVIPYEDLEAVGFDAIVLGHIHRYQWLSDSGLYVGSPMPLNFGEADQEHGVTILEFGGDGRFERSEFVPVDSPPFVTYDLDLTDDAEAAFSFRPPTDAIVRVRYRATAARARDVDVFAWKRELLELGAKTVKIVPDIVRVDRARVDGADENLAPLEALDLFTSANQIEAELAARMRERTTSYLEAVAS